MDWDFYQSQQQSDLVLLWSVRFQQRLHSFRASSTSSHVHKRRLLMGTAQTKESQGAWDYINRYLYWNGHQKQAVEYLYSMFTVSLWSILLAFYGVAIRFKMQLHGGLKGFKERELFGWLRSVKSWAFYPIFLIDVSFWANQCNNCFWLSTAGSQVQGCIFVLQIPEAEERNKHEKGNHSWNMVVVLVGKTKHRTG